MARAWLRHRMVKASPRAWAELVARRSDLADEPLLAAWAERSWPLVVRRPACADVVGQVPLGLPLPPAQGRRRILLTLPPEAVADDAPPPLLKDAAASAPTSWLDAIDALVALNGQTRCFGSLAWAHLTGLDYLTASSDLDLLWPVKSAAQADRLAQGLAAIQAWAPMQIDGEFFTAAGWGVQWREWASPAPEVITKTTRDVFLLSRAEILS